MSLDLGPLELTPIDWGHVDDDGVLLDEDRPVVASGEDDYPHEDES
jgi:hypothetical protein